MSSDISLLASFLNKPRRYRKKVRRARKSRMNELARPSERRMEDLLKTKKEVIPKQCCMNIKEILEEKHFQNPWSTELYFREREMSKRPSESCESLSPERKEWFEKVSAEIARLLSPWLVQHFECGVSPKNSYSNLEELSDIILEKVSCVLDEPMPKRKDPERISRFMIAVSDRFAIWMDDKIGNLP